MICIPIAVLIFLVFLGIDFLYPVTETPYADLILGLVATVVGEGCELIGLKGRFFFLPIWFFGFLIVGVQFYEIWGWLGGVLFGGIFVFLWFGLLFIDRVNERKKWSIAGQTFKEAKAYYSKGDLEKMWDCLSKTYFTPKMMKYIPEIYDHNIAVLSFITEHLKDGITTEHMTYLHVQVQYFEEAKVGQKEKPRDWEALSKFITTLISSKGQMDSNQLDPK